MERNTYGTVNIFAPVQDQLRQVEALMRRQADVERHPDLKAALDHLLDSGGKRVRPAVALLVGGMLGGQVEALVTLAAAIELLHTATLVHDDLIDGAFLRRGIATLNAQWSPAATVLTGDFIFARAAVLAAEAGSVAVMQDFSETLAAIVSGELIQLFSGRGLASRENYEKRIYAKTASMFELAASAAAMLSPVAPDEVELARGFGYQIGMAFQIVDDVLDFTGEQAMVGKPVGSDLRQGLITLPALIYLQDCPGDADFMELLESGRIGEVEMNRLVDRIAESRSIAASMEEAAEFSDRGLALLDAFPENEFRQALVALSKYIVHREF